MRPLDGIRVLDLSRFQACPLCGMFLGDMGAEVIRIEEPAGAPDRTWGQLGPDGETLLYKVVSRNKKCITLNLKTPGGRNIFHQLVKISDVVLHNFAPGAPIAGEVSYDRLRQINASVIVAAVSGYGQSGPDANHPCFDGVAQGRSGSIPMNGFPGDPPVKTGLPYIDVSSGQFAALGVMMALYHRERTGEGQAVDVSLFDTAFFATQSVGTLMVYALYGEIREKIGNRGYHSYNGCFKAKDRWVVVATATDSIWKRFIRAIGREDMVDDPRFASDMDRFRNARFIDDTVGKWAEERTADEILRLFQKARVPCSVMNSVDRLLTDAQVTAREMIVEMDYPGLGKMPVPGIPMKLSLTPGSIHAPSPKLGEHNEEIFGGLLNLNQEKLAALKQEGVI